MGGWCRAMVDGMAMNARMDEEDGVQGWKMHGDGGWRIDGPCILILCSYKSNFQLPYRPLQALLSLLIGDGHVYMP